MALPYRANSPSLAQIDAPRLKPSVCYRESKRCDVIYFVIISTDLIGKLMDHVCGSWGSSKDDARFFGDGVRIHQHYTPESVSKVTRELRWYSILFALFLRTKTGLQLEIEDGDMIDFYT
jgi:hypothetical protein